MPPNFYHQVSFSRRQFSLARIFFGKIFFLARLFRAEKNGNANKKSCRKKSRAKKEVVPKKKGVPEKTDVVKKKLDDKNYVALTVLRRDWFFQLKLFTNFTATHLKLFPYVT